MVDNLSDALYLAGAMLIFVLALTVSMSSFTKIRTQIDSLVQAEAKEDLVTDEDGNYLKYNVSASDGDIRVVGIDTVISSIYRVAKENYNVYIKLKNLDATWRDSGKIKSSYPEKDDVGYYTIKISLNSSDTQTNYASKENLDGILELLYKDLSDKKFEEYLGVYQYQSAEGVDTSNKITYRIITYIEQ